MERDGYSESAWVSLVVKSVRMGWPEGLCQAEARLASSRMRNVLLVQLFEDVWPTEQELAEAVAETQRGDWLALCSRETLHGRGYADRFCDLAEEAIAAAEDPARAGLFGEARRLGLPWMSGRVWNVFWTWLRVAPTDGGVRRTIDETPWREMPTAMLDGHTREGRRRRVEETILSGTYEQHRRIGQMVMEHGWQPLREVVHAELEPAPPEQPEQLRLID